MKRFMSSAASSSSARAEPATMSSSFSSAEQPTTSLGSAEQPGTRCQLKLSSIRDVQRWLAKESIASCSSADMQRIREAAAVLVHGKPRKEDVRPLQSKWRVVRQKKTKQKDRCQKLSTSSETKSSKQHSSCKENYQTVLNRLLQVPSDSQVPRIQLTV